MMLTNPLKQEEHVKPWDGTIAVPQRSGPTYVWKCGPYQIVVVKNDVEFLEGWSYGGFCARGKQIEPKRQALEYEVKRAVEQFIRTHHEYGQCLYKVIREPKESRK
jgi:hypothetical protein